MQKKLPHKYTNYNLNTPIKYKNFYKKPNRPSNKNYIPTRKFENY